MKTIQTEREVPAYTVTDESFACDECAFTSDSVEETLRHEYEKHSFSGQKSVAGADFLKFDSEEAFKRWKDYWEHEETSIQIDAPWKGPGWYRAWTEWRSRGCGCNCRDEWRCLEPAAQWVATLEAQDKALQTQRQALTDLTGDPS